MRRRSSFIRSMQRLHSKKLGSMAELYFEADEDSSEEGDPDKK